MCNKKEVSVCSLRVKKKKSAIFILKLNFWTITAHVRNILFTYPCPGMLSIKLYDGTCSKQKQSIIHNHLSLLHPGCWACFPVLLHQTDTSRQALMSLELCIQTKQWECTWNKVVSAAMRIMSSLQSGYWVLCINRKLKLKLMALDAFFFFLNLNSNVALCLVACWFALYGLHFQMTRWTYKPVGLKWAGNL